jgi:hypothetical protein
VVVKDACGFGHRDSAERSIASLEFAGDALLTNADTFCTQLARNHSTYAGAAAQLDSHSIKFAVSTEEKLHMIQRRLRVAKWLSTTPAVGVCTLCSREFKVSVSALRRTADAQASLQEEFDRHNCVPEDSSQASARVNADVLLRDEPEDEEEEDDRKEEDDDDDDEGDGYSE